METLFSGIFDSELVSVISPADFMLCMICAIFIGLILAGMYMYKNRYTKSFVATLAVLLGGISVVYNKTDFGERKNAAKYKTLHVTIPENLDYSGVFDEIFADYAEKWELVNVKTTNMGSLYKLTYQLTMKNTDREKEMIDEIRCRNGNLEINVSKQDTMVSEL